MAWFSKIFGGPNRAETDSRSLDQQTRRQLAGAGADLTKPTDVVNYLYAPDEAGAQRAAGELRAAGYTVEVRPAATGSNWLAKANRDLVPSPENIAEMRALFEKLAAVVKGDYDGWEAAVTR